MNIKEAIEVLKYLSGSIKIGGGKSLIYTRDAEAIDTVVSFCEERMQNDKVDFLKSAKQPNQIRHPYDLSK